MAEFFKFALGWLLFMGIVAAIALVTPKIAPKIEKIAKSMKCKKEIANPYDIGEEPTQITAADTEQDFSCEEENHE